MTFKCDVLWCMLDALHYAYVTPGLIPPGAFVTRMMADTPKSPEPPTLAPGVRLHFDTTRNAWMLLGLNA